MALVLGFDTLDDPLRGAQGYVHVCAHAFCLPPSAGRSRFPSLLWDQLIPAHTGCSLVDDNRLPRRS